MKKNFLSFFIALMVVSLSFAQEKAVFENVATVFDPATARPDEKYATTRIPALVSTKKGTLLAFCEARAEQSDWADMDILLRRSTDGGKTWLPSKVFAGRQNKQPVSNCTPIVDADGQTIHVLYVRNYAVCYYTMSTNEGATWSEPTDITYAFAKFRPEYDWRVIAPGPGHAIQLAIGPHRGRLVVPAWLCDPDPSRPGGEHRPSCIATVYSDDLGQTWQRGAIVANNGDVVGGDTIVNPSENVAAQLADGRLMLNIRTESAPHRRLVAYSPDGATNWTQPIFDDELFDPVCMASLIRLPGRGKEKTALLFVNPDSEANAGFQTKALNFRKRENLTVKLSYDEGQTWPIEKVIDPGQSGYSDLAVGPDGTIYCLYEAKQQDQKAWIYKLILKKFNRAWLK